MKKKCILSKTVSFIYLFIFIAVKFKGVREIIKDGA